MRLHVRAAILRCRRVLSEFHIEFLDIEQREIYSIIASERSRLRTIPVYPDDVHIRIDAVLEELSKRTDHSFAHIISVFPDQVVHAHMSLQRSVDSKEHSITVFFTCIKHEFQRCTLCLHCLVFGDVNKNDVLVAHPQKDIIIVKTESLQYTIYKWWEFLFSCVCSAFKPFLDIIFVVVTSYEFSEINDIASCSFIVLSMNDVLNLVIPDKHPVIL